MALTSVHILLTYTCTHECDHCFLFCSPRAKGTFTLEHIRQLLDQAVELGTVSSICFEGGEPFLFHPLLLEGLRCARERGFSTGVVTNCYWATAVEDAGLWLRPAVEAGIGDLSVSDDMFHHSDQEENPAARAARAAADLGMPATSICIEKPQVLAPRGEKGEPVVGGDVLLKGRAAETLTEGLPTRPTDSFQSCPHEELVAPSRVHVDVYGNVMPCQGVSIGNFLETPLAAMMAEYDAAKHPVCGPLVRGGPKALAEEHGVTLDGNYVDECHYCFAVRTSLIDRFPGQLAPRQVYGLEERTETTTRG